MENLSNREPLPGSLTPTSQVSSVAMDLAATGPPRGDLTAAMTAPGPSAAEQDAVRPLAPPGLPEGIGDPAPWTMADGSPWRKTHDVTGGAA